MAVEFLCRLEVWVAFALIISLFYALFRRRDAGGRVEPPGPWGLPVFGYLPFLGRKMNLTINQLAKKYGDVFQFRLGSRKVVVTSGQKTLRNLKRCWMKGLPLLEDLISIHTRSQMNLSFLTLLQPFDFTRSGQ